MKDFITNGTLVLNKRMYVFIRILSVGTNKVLLKYRVDVSNDDWQTAWTARVGSVMSGTKLLARIIIHYIRRAVEPASCVHDGAD